MVPKFRGDSDDWLDDESQKSGSRGPKKKSSSEFRSTEPLRDDEANATVAEVFPHQCRVRLDEDRSQPLCTYRKAAIHFGEETRERSPVAVGDRVRAEFTAGTTPGASGVITGACRRKNRLARPAPDLEDRQHTLAANLDLLVIVASVAHPEFKPGLVDRFWVAALAQKIPALLCINKIDLREEGESPWAFYPEIGLPVIEVSAKKQIGIEPLRQALAEKTALFCGTSGAGKTSLLKLLIPEFEGKTGEISDATGKGRHTTSSARLLEGSDGMLCIDAPGVKEFGLLRIEPAELAGFFPEMKHLSCNRSGCHHFDEEGCSARNLPRYAGYRRIYESLLSGEG